jgi:excisionase family DNA binding protein
MTSNQTLSHATITVVPDRMTLNEAAHYLGIPVATLTTWRSRRPGYGPRAMLYGATLRFRKADLDEWMESRLEQFDPDTGASVEAHGRGRSTPPNALPSMTRGRSRRSA